MKHSLLFLMLIIHRMQHNMQEFRIKTWTCPGCGYQQDFEPTAVNYAIHFRNEMFQAGVSLQDDDCPACVMGKNPNKKKRPRKLVVEKVLEKKIRKRVLDASEIDTLEKEEPTGNMITVAGREKPEFKRVKITVREKNRLKAQRLKDLEEIQGLME